MRIIKSIPEMHEHCKQLKRDGKTIASINTGGILHDGHMSLVKIAKENADVVVVMIDFPIEFIKYFEQYDEFYGMYENDNLKKDIELCKKHSVDVFFSPSMSDMYGDRVTKITLSNPFVEDVILKRNNLVIAPEHMVSYIKEFNILCQMLLY